MNNHAFALVVALACALVVLVVPIWFSLKAKPVGDKPYRWGTYTGICHGLLFVAIVLAGFRAEDTNLPPIAVVCLSFVLCSPLALISIGLLSRRRYGVVAFFIVQTFFWLAGLASVRQGSDKTALQLIFGAAYLAATAAYFSKRWKFMGAGSRLTSSIRNTDEHDAEPIIGLVKTDPVGQPRQTVSCPACGRETSCDGKLCLGCGASLEMLRQISSPQVGNPSPQELCRRCGSGTSPGHGHAVYSEAVQGLTAGRRVFFSIPVSGSFEKGDHEIKRFGAMLYCDSCARAMFTTELWEEAKAMRVEMDQTDANDKEAKKARSEVVDFGIALPAKRRGIGAEQARLEARELAALWWKDRAAAKERLIASSAAAKAG